LAGNAGATPELFEMLIGDAKLIGQTANRVQTTLNKATGKLNHSQGSGASKGHPGPAHLDPLA
jgi:hypothetical protein